VRVGVITTSRADYSIYLPLLKEMEKDDQICLTVFSLGMHNSENYGMTVERIKKDGFKTVSTEDALVYGHSSDGVSKSVGKTVMQMSDMLKENKQDLIICLGDRFEMFGAVSAVIPFGLPIAHIHGGEITEGAIDEKYRHAITKLADIHFTTCENHKNRVLQMGSVPSQTFNVGSLGVQNLKTVKSLSLDKIEEKFGIDMTKKTILGTYQPVTTETAKSEYMVNEFCKSLEELNYQFVLTLGNADTSGDIFIKKITELGKKNPEKYKIFENLGVEGYVSVMKHSDLVIGNSSSGIIEAASLSKPVVNIGNRQKGRQCSDNVIHCSEESLSILEAVKKAEELVGKSFNNVYEKENTAEEIIIKLKNMTLSPNYKFNDLEGVNHV